MHIKFWTSTSSNIQIGDVVTTEFVSGHLKNNMKLGSSFLYVERQLENGTWMVVGTDADWNTKILWRRKNIMTGESRVTIEWHVQPGTEPGTYRIRHSGYSKSLLNRKISEYEGSSEHFYIPDPTAPTTTTPGESWWPFGK